MQKELLARLRLLARQAGDTGSPDSLEKVISRFVEDVSLSIHPRLLKTLEDAEIRAIYRKWSQHVLAGCQREDLLDWLALSPINPFREPTARTPEDPENTVVPLFR